MEAAPAASETPVSSEVQQLVSQGLSSRIAQRVGDIFASGALSPEELDDRALDALREFNEDGAVEVLNQFANSDLSHVQNKSAFLCGVMKTFREKSRHGQYPTPETDDSRKGPYRPDEEKIKALLERTGYTLDITLGQRKYGGPPPNYEGPAPGTSAEKACSQVFVGKIPRDCFEDELIPVLEEPGQIYDFRLMMDPMSGQNRGYGFCTYVSKEAAREAVSRLDNKEIRPGKRLGVCISVANNRLFVGSIPKTKSKEEIMEEFSKVTTGLTDVIVYLSADHKGKNRGFAFLEYESHQAASLARRRLASGRIKVWGNIIVTVDWAELQDEPDAEVMAKVKVAYVRNLTPNVSEEKLKEDFSKFGTVERVKKLKDYAFVHFTEREPCVKAVEEMNGQVMDDATIEVSLARPRPPNQERRSGQAGFGNMNYGGRGGVRGGRGGPRGGRGGGYNQGYDGGYGGRGGGYGGGYDDHYGGGYGGGYMGHDEYYGGGGGYGYDDYGGGRGWRGMSRGRARGGPPHGGGPWGGGRGGRGGPGRGGPFRGGRGGPRGGGPTMPGKRKYGADNPQGPVGYPEPKRRFSAPGSQNQQWGSQPIAQQPLGQDAGYSQGDQPEWYQDYNQQGW